MSISNKRKLNHVFITEAEIARFLANSLFNVTFKHTYIHTYIGIYICVHARLSVRMSVFVYVCACAREGGHSYIAILVMMVFVPPLYEDACACIY